MTLLDTGKPPAGKPLAALLAGSGVLHFLTPRPYPSIVPRLPLPVPLVARALRPARAK